MARNTLGDLNNHLFMQLERLNEEDLEGEKLQEEITRAKAITGLASQIIANGTLVIKAEEFRQEYGFNGSTSGGGSGAIGDGDGKSKKRKRLPAMLREEHLGELLAD